MKKIIIPLMLCFGFFFKINAQSHIDNTKLRCLYKYDYTYNLSHPSQKLIDTMMLEIGKDICKFYSYHNYIIDSICRNSDRGTWMLYKPTPNKYTLYVNYPKNKTTVIDNVVGTIKNFEYIEDFEIPKWTIHSETQTILSHPCKKATCRFRGRDYVAWYAVDIPISRGPYKFAGLPGLILKIADTENLYSFECTGIENSNKSMYEDRREYLEAILITKAEFRNMEKRFYENPKVALEAALKSVGMNVDEIQDIAKERNVSVPTNLIKKYNPIELE